MKKMYLWIEKNPIAPPAPRAEMPTMEDQYLDVEPPIVPPKFSFTDASDMNGDVYFDSMTEVSSRDEYFDSPNNQPTEDLAPMAGLTFDVLPESLTAVEPGEELFLPHLDELNEWVIAPPNHSEAVVEVAGEDLSRESLIMEDPVDLLLASAPGPRRSTRITGASLPHGCIEILFMSIGCKLW